MVFISLDYPPDARTVEFAVRNCPQKISIGDMFQLNIFKDFGEAKIIHDFIDDKIDLRTLKCEVSPLMIIALVSKASLIPSTLHYFELPEQVWGN